MMFRRFAVSVFSACVCGSLAAAVPLAGLECDVEKFAANRLAGVQTTLNGFEDYFVKAFENDVKKAIKDAKDSWEKDGLCRGVNAEHAYKHAHELMEEVRTKAYSELERESVVFAPRGDEMIIRDIHRKSCMWNEEETQKALQAAEVARIEWYKTLALFYDHEFSNLRTELLTFSAKYVASGKCTLADKVNSQWGAWYPQDRFQGFKMTGQKDANFGDALKVTANI
eukprot:comp11842_c0_seq1/m.6469 comp11842_c0_seq1/g.6469  ORF comp11842_c0_seq1/g.6469 comp11842_c0_seq1/m.6469 type:complete len:226 (-) comp11842_c0_seq1:800-1477(-)